MRIARRSPWCLPRRLVIIGLLCVLSGLPAQAGEVEVEPDELRAVAREALRRAEPDVAVGYAEALLTRNDEDVGAHLLRARGLRDMGREGEARAAAMSAWRLADTPEARHASALVMAQALASAGQRTRAQWWLRRAVHHAPDEAARRRAIRDFRYVRARNPWSTELRFSVAPRSNVNGGSARSTIRIYDLPFDFRLRGSAQALSGTEIAAGVSTGYRLRGSARRKTEAILRADYRTYRLTDDAQDKAPTVEGSDFALGSLAVTLAETWRSRTDGAPRRVAATLGQVWYGGAPYTSFLRLSGRRHWALGSRRTAHVSVMAEAQRGRDGRADSGKLRVGAGTARQLASGHRLRLHVAATASRSRAAARDYDRLEAGARLDLAEPVLGAVLDFGLRVEGESYAGRFFGMTGREDRTVTLDATADLAELEQYGFMPSVTIRAERTQSTLGLYDTEKLGLELGWRSAF